MYRKSMALLGMILLAALVMCVGIRFSLGKLPLAFGAKTSELDNIIVNMEPDRFLDKDFIKYLQADRKEENLKELFESSTSLLVVRIKDDPVNYQEWSTAQAEVQGIVWSRDKLQVGDCLPIMTENVFLITNDMKSDYSYGNFHTPLMIGRYYLMALRNYTTGSKNSTKIAAKRGVTLQEWYTSMDFGWYPYLPLEENLVVKAVEKGKHYRMKELMDYETFSFDQEVVEEWHKTRLRILDYYLGNRFTRERKGG